MSNAKHTPGPWHLDLGCDILQGHVGISAKSHGALAQVVWKMEDDERSPQCEANAALIAAAPELLEALIAVSEHIDFKNPAYQQAYAAIAKAKGEA